MNPILGKIMVARTNLVIDAPFFASLALKLEVLETRQIKTMATDGVRLLYNPDFVKSITPREVEAVICHEVMHCAAGHVWRRGGRQRKKWNIACDYAINPMIVAANYKLPKGVLLDNKYLGMTAEKIYNLLPDGGSGSGGDSNAGDRHGESESDEGNEAPPDCDYDFGPNHDPDIDVLDAPKGKEAEIEADWRISVLQAAKAAKAMGKLPAGLEREVTEAVRPRMDWRSILRRFVQETARNDYSWSAPSTRYASLGLYLPRIRSEEMPPIVVAIDTSGSIGSSELHAFRAELEAIVDEMNPKETHVLYADASVARADHFEQGDSLTFKPAGGGGTNFIPAFDWVEKEGIEPACFIYLTDMFGTFPTKAPSYPVLWVSTSNVVGPFGDTVRMDP